MRKALTVAIIAVMLFSSLALLPAPARAEDNLVQANTMRGWSFPNETVEPLTSAPTHLTVKADANFTIEYTDSGMKITTNANTTFKNVEFIAPEGTNAITAHFARADTTDEGFSIVFGMYDPDTNSLKAATKVVFSTAYGIKTLNSINYYIETTEFTLAFFKDENDNFQLYYNNQLIYTYTSATAKTQIAFFVRDTNSATSGSIYVSDVHYTTDPILEPLKYWHDTLHSTPVPWGYDFQYTLVIHPDRSTYNMTKLLFETIDKYGIKATQVIFLHPGGTTDRSEAIDNKTYLNLLLNEEKKGHEIAVHALENYDINRTKVIEELEEFKSLFGHYPYGWFDHGVVKQDLSQQGSNQSSEYYIYDILTEKLKYVWVTSEQTEDNPSQRLYIDIENHGINIHSIMTVQYAKVRYALSNMTTTYFFDLAMNKVLFMEHVYGSVIEYIEFPNGTKYCRLPNEAELYGFTQKDFEYEYEKNWESLGGTWHIFPYRESFFSIMAKNYSVWFATASEVVDYYNKWEKLQFDFSASYVNISNPTTHAVSGVTIYTTEEPDYALYNPSNGMYYYPVKSNVTNTWNFVINKVPKLSELHLRKVKVSMPQLKIGSNPVAMWGDGSKLYIYAQKDGLVHVQPIFSVSSNTIVKDLTTGKTVSWEKGSIIFTAQAGHTYEICNQLTQAINISIDWTYTIVNAMIPIAIFAVLLSALTQILQAVRKSVRFRK